MIVYEDSNINSYLVNGNKYFICNNVKKYIYDEVYKEKDKWIIESYNYSDFLEENKILEVSNYFIMDNRPESAFGHWFYECFIFIFDYIELKKKINNLKLVLMDRKNFKNLFLNYLNIREDDIYYIDLKYPEVVEEDKICNLLINMNNIYFFNKLNICYFHLTTSALNEFNLSNEYKKYIDKIFDFFEPKNNIKNINTLLMPRQNKETKSRICDTIDIENNMKNKKVGKILNTSEIIKLEDQMDIVSKSSIIIITDGAPVLVNCLFSRSTIFIICDTHTLSESQSFPKYNYIMNKHFNNNKLIYTTCHPNATSYQHHSKYTYNDILNIINKFNLKSDLF